METASLDEGTLTSAKGLEMGLDEIRDRATLTVEETAEMLGVGRSSAYEAARRGDIPTMRLGRRLVVPVPALMRLLEQPRSTPI